MPRSRRIDPDDITDEAAEAAEVETDEDPAPRPRPRRARSAPTATRPTRRSQRETEPEDDDADDVYDEDDDDDTNEEPEPAPRSSRKGKSRASSKPVPRSRSKRDEEDPDDEETVSIPVYRGRTAIKKNRPVSEASKKFFYWDEEPQLVKFLDEEPWAYDQHWVKRDGKQSFPCSGSGCPLCAIGVKVEQKVVYTVVNLTPRKGDEPLVQTLEVSLTNDETLQTLDADSKTGPLSRLWWAISRSEKKTGSRKSYSYSFLPVKDRDLDEDWGVDLDEAEDAVEAAEVPTFTDVIGKWTRSSLQEIADEVMGRH